MTEEIATYYLSGRNVAFPQVSATNYLLGKMAEWCSVMGYKNINLGGGRTNSVNDSLFKFKKNFSKKNCDYYIGKRIHKPIVYEQLKELFIVKFGAEKYEKQKHFLQFYRTE
jgi:lipid II:glycine glycyltransferase (peptidoglycan interpeptide bridge formation enzyme)